MFLDIKELEYGGFLYKNYSQFRKEGVNNTSNKKCEKRVQRGNDPI